MPEQREPFRAIRCLSVERRRRKRERGRARRSRRRVWYGASGIRFPRIL